MIIKSFMASDIFEHYALIGDTDGLTEQEKQCFDVVVKAIGAKGTCLTTKGHVDCGFGRCGVIDKLSNRCLYEFEVTK